MAIYFSLGEQGFFSVLGRGPKAFQIATRVVKHYIGKTVIVQY